MNTLVLYSACDVLCEPDLCHELCFLITDFFFFFVFLQYMERFTATKKKFAWKTKITKSNLVTGDMTIKTEKNISVKVQTQALRFWCTEKVSEE